MRWAMATDPRSPSAILTFHSLDDSGSVISYNPDSFRTAMDALDESGIPIVSVREALRRPGSLALTFDDAFVNFATDGEPNQPANAQAAAVTATAVEVMLAAVLPLGWQRRWFAKGTAGLLVIYLVAMTASLGLDAVADYAVPILVGGALLLSSVPTRREAHDLTNNRCRQRTELIAAPRPASPA